MYLENRMAPTMCLFLLHMIPTSYSNLGGGSRHFWKKTRTLGKWSNLTNTYVSKWVLWTCKCWSKIQLGNAWIPLPLEVEDVNARVPLPKAPCMDYTPEISHRYQQFLFEGSPPFPTHRFGYPCSFSGVFVPTKLGSFHVGKCRPLPLSGNLVFISAPRFFVWNFWGHKGYGCVLLQWCGLGATRQGFRRRIVMQQSSPACHGIRIRDLFTCVFFNNNLRSQWTWRI